MNESFFKKLLDMSLQMAHTRDLEPLLTYAMQEAIALVDAEMGHIILFEGEDQLNFRVSLEKRGLRIAAPATQISRSILAKVRETGKSLVILDALQDIDLSKRTSINALSIRSVMCVPLQTQHRMIGALYLENRSDAAIFEDEDVVPLEYFASQAAIAIENAMLNTNLEAQVRARTAELLEAKKVLEARNAALEQALDTIKTLSGLIPICAWCGRKISDEEGHWVSVERYIETHTDASFTHGICPECLQEFSSQS